MKYEELVAIHSPTSPLLEEEDVEDQDQYLIDAEEAVDLLRKCKILLSYVACKDLCKSVTQRERSIFQKLSDDISEYMDQTTIDAQD